MHNDWPTQQQDMLTATAIVNKHLEFTEGEPLGFLEVVVSKNKEKILEIKMPSWINDLLTHFQEQYGHEHGHAVTSKVLTKLLLKNEVIH